MLSHPEFELDEVFKPLPPFPVAIFLPINSSELIFDCVVNECQLQVMEALVIVTILLFFWTQQVLFPTKPANDDKPKESEELANALKKFLEAGIKVKNES